MVLLFLLMAGPLPAQQSVSVEGRSLYDALKKFELQGKASVSSLILKRDRAEMSFTGDFYFASPINGRVTGAVFIGQGTFTAAPPVELPFEQENMMRFLNEEVAESDFRVAVLRFSDDTYDVIGKAVDAEAAVPNDAVSAAKDFEPRLMEETGANISSRLLISFENQESPGFFLAQFDKGRRGRFTFILDPQTRIPGSAFNINGGEKVLLFTYAPYSYINDIWMATYSEEDFKRKQVKYSDVFDLVSPLHYAMQIDLRSARRGVRANMRIDFESSDDNLRVLPMLLNQELTEFDNRRKDESMRLKSARYGDQELAFVQESWEKGLAIIFPKPMRKGEKFSLELSLEGDIIHNQSVLENCYYPQSNTDWFPRHGYLKRSTFDLTFRHSKNDVVASIGKLVREAEPWPDAQNDRLTQFKMDQPVSFATFAAGLIERHSEKRKLDFGEMLIDFYSLPTGLATIKESFVLAELGNCLNYFGSYFGAYPYDSFKAVVHPFSYGQGIPTQLMIPPADQANKKVFEFLAHETSHQWWGNLVSWRSYRDQWLSEGFARYSGILYVGFRYNLEAKRDIIEEIRYGLPFPPKTDRGVLSGKVAEIGPLILGLRLRTRNTLNAYSQLIYDKGGLVLRMLHFLFTDPSTGEGQPFFTMLADFVKQYQNQAASTEDFWRVSSEHFVNTPIAKAFGLKNLDWFFQQWVYQAKLPSYRLEYRLEPAQNNQFILNWTVTQENAGPNWFMPLPVVFKFPGNQKAQTVVYVNGPKTSSKMVLPAKPSSVELDPEYWVLTEKTSTKKI